MQSIKQIQRLNQKELDNAVPPSASWHTDYRDTAYVYIGGLPLDLSEGDVITIFSQYGDPVWIKLARDKDSGQSRGFAWLKYEDQRSCDLAVDNLSGATVMGRLLNVDHARYKMRDDENEADGYVGQERMLEEEEKHSGRRNRPRSDSESDGESRRPLIKEEVELAKLLKDQDDDDPMKAYMIDQKKEEVERALQAAKKSSHREKRRDHDRDKTRRKDGDRDRHRESRRHAEDDEGAKERCRRRSASREDRHRRSYRDRSRSPRR